MTFAAALARFVDMDQDSQARVFIIFKGICSAFDDVNDAFAQAVEDESYAIETEMRLLERSDTMVM